MAYILDSNTVALTLGYTGDYFASGGGSTTFGFVSDTPFIPDDLEAMAVVAITTWDVLLQGFYSDHVTLSSVNVRNDTYSFTNGANIQGAAGLDTLAPNTAVLYSFSSAFAGPRGRGRVYLPGWAFENQVSDLGVIDPLIVADMTSALNTYVEGLETAGPGITFQVILQGDTGISPPLGTVPVRGRQVQGRVATQRRRLRK